MAGIDPEGDVDTGTSSGTRLIPHCGLRGYEVLNIKMSLLKHKSHDFSTKRVIFSKLPKKFSTSLINDTRCKMAALNPLLYL